MKRTKAKPQFVVWLLNDACDDLELRKIYQALPDEVAAEDGYIRVIDESGEDYLSPANYFLPIALLKERTDTLAVLRQRLATLGRKKGRSAEEFFTEFFARNNISA